MSNYQNQVSYNPNVALVIGIKSTVVLQHIYTDCQEHPSGANDSLLRAKERRSIQSLLLTFSYLTERQLRRLLDGLEKDGLLTSVYMKGYDRTKVYSITEDGVFLIENGHLPDRKVG